MLPQTATYALRALAYLATRKDDGPILSRTIADEMSIPKNFLSKILNRLVQADMVISVRGSRGGFVLARDPSDVSMREVAALFMKIDDFSRCFLGFQACDGTCGVHRRWKPITERIEEMMETTTMEEIL